MGLRTTACLLLLLAFATAAAGPASAEPAFGVLQFHTEHDLETADCLSRQDCFLRFEDDETGIAAWLARIAKVSDLAVLHWDRPVPWLVFDVDVPAGADRTAFYDARLDARTVAWIDAFAVHFAAMGRGYLAVSLLSGERNALAELHTGFDTQVPVGPECPDFSPGARFEVDPGSGPESFDLERSDRNFVLYLAAKLHPGSIALMVEANLIEVTCPERADGLYSLYRNLYDAVRRELGPGVSLFATLSYPVLLAYDPVACYPTLDFEACGLPPGPPAPDAGAAACFPTVPSTLEALNRGDRLDVLALSFYPDGLEMNPLPDEAPQTSAFLLDTWNAGGACTSRKRWPAPVDPLAAIDRLGWTGPVAIAETSARSCVSPLRTDVAVPGGTDPTALVLEIAGSRASQAEWVRRTWRWARDRGFVFYVYSFLRDYPPVGPWTVDQGVLSPSLQNLLDIWPCSGLEDAQGVPKPELAAIGLPEPPAGVSAWVATGVLAIAWRRRGRS